MKTITREEWMLVTTCVGSGMVLGGNINGLSLTALAQRITDEEWNNFCSAFPDCSPTMKRTDDTTPDSE